MAGRYAKPETNLKIEKATISSDGPIRITDDSEWTWLQLWDPPKKRQISGKYLFFSQSRELLIQIAKSEIRSHGFSDAKVSKNPPGHDDVLCLYWADDSRKVELAQRHGGSQNLRYRYWKSDADTEAGKYSEQFLASKVSVDRVLFNA